MKKHKLVLVFAGGVVAGTVAGAAAWAKAVNWAFKRGLIKEGNPLGLKVRRDIA